MANCHPNLGFLSVETGLIQVISAATKSKKGHALSVKFFLCAKESTVFLDTLN